MGLIPPPSLSFRDHARIIGGGSARPTSVGFWKRPRSLAPASRTWRAVMASTAGNDQLSETVALVRNDLRRRPEPLS